MELSYSKTITSLAILRINWEVNHKDYIDNFIPFILNLVIKNNYKKVDLSTLREDFKKEYGLILPLAPLLVILKRASKQGYFVKEDNQYFPISNKIASSNFMSISQDQERKLNQVVNEFKNFIKGKYEITISVEDAEAYLLKFLRNEDLNTVFNTETIEDLYVAPTIPESLEDRSRYFVAKFLEEIWKNNHTIFRFVSDLITGQMLAHTILNPDIQNYQGRLRGQNFYLDIAFLFSLSGVDGNEIKGVYKELVDALMEAEASLFTFRHTFNEFTNILESDRRSLMRGNIDFEKASRSLKSFILNEDTVLGIETIIDTAETRIKEMGISIVDSPDWNSTNQDEIDAPELRAIIVKKYKERDPFFKEIEKDYTIQKDIDSISAIQRLRRHNRPKSLPSAEHTLITGNPALASACNTFANQDGNFTIPSCLHHLFIGTLLFLEMPTRITKINEKKLMADAYAAMKPSEELLKKYWVLIDDLSKKGDIKPDDYIVLRSSTVARSMLQEKTLGSVSNLTSKTPKEILFDIDSRAKVEAQAGRLAEETAHAVTKEKLERVNSRANATEEKIKRTIKAASEISSNAIYVVILIALCVMFYYSNNTIIRIILILLAIFGYATGFHFLKLRDKVNNLLRDFLTKKFL